ncbi:MAG: peroxide stress protein YaaA [Myxococcota bacterium]|nr:peroxide stress protein YaaA [Myxococcota bacterium]
MLTLLSPAKSLDWSPTPGVAPTTPRLSSDFGVLMRQAKRLKPADLKTLMKLSDKLAQLNHERFQEMTVAPDPARDRPAALAFAGDVYQGLDARSLSPEALSWAQERVAILSGLYGVLRPLDLIQPYRLEMGTRLKTRRGGSLYDFWGDRVSLTLNAQLKAHDEPTVIDLASGEYGRVVTKKLNARRIVPVFQEVEADGRHRIISFFAKRARGQMTRFIIDQRIDTPAGIKDFTAGGYVFQPSQSASERWVFTRPR